MQILLSLSVVQLRPKINKEIVKLGDRWNQIYILIGIEDRWVMNTFKNAMLIFCFWRLLDGLPGPSGDHWSETSRNGFIAWLMRLCDLILDVVIWVVVIFDFCSSQINKLGFYQYFQWTWKRGVGSLFDSPNCPLLACKSVKNFVKFKKSYSQNNSKTQIFEVFWS